MIVATPDGKFYSEAGSELDGFKMRFSEITKEQAVHYCQASEDFIVHRRLTLLERLRVRK